VIRFDCVTLFPEAFAAVTGSGVTRRALEQRLWSLGLWNPRDFTADNYRTVDDRPYGGGPGMVMLAEPLEKAIATARAAAQGGSKVIHLSPQGPVMDHRKVMELAAEPRLVLLCGRYEGVDERLVRRSVDEELSIGDYVLSGGELAAMVLIDAVVRAGLVRKRAPRLPAVHAAGNVCGRGGAAGAALGPPCADRALAAEAVARPHLAAQAGAARAARDERERTQTA
jgi:tRNA (guanine-N1)-methyltransferase